MQPRSIICIPNNDISVTEAYLSLSKAILIYISQDQHSSGLPPKLHTVHGHWMSTTSWTILKVSNSGDTDIADHLVECLDNARLESEMGGNYEITKEWHTYRRHPLDEGIVKVTPISPEEVDAGELQNSCNPETWKRPKKASSYLPISVLSMCYKLLERIILYRIAPLASAIYGCVVCILMYRHSLRWSTAVWCAFSCTGTRFGDQRLCGVHSHVPALASVINVYGCAYIIDKQNPEHCTWLHLRLSSRNILIELLPLTWNEETLTICTKANHI